MAAEHSSAVRLVEVNRALHAWRQGDCVLGEHWFVHRLAVELPVTDAGRTAANDGIDLAEQAVAGLVVVSQTCDIVRACEGRPYVEVSPLVEVDADKLREIERGRRPTYAFLPRLAPSRLVADLDRVITVEKPLVASWNRTPGCGSDTEARALALALTRKRARFAFPDDFTSLAKKLQNRLLEKHDKASDEGRGLRALREIRAHAAPSWNAEQVTLTLWFIRHDQDADFAGDRWTDLLPRWLKLLPESGRFTNIQGQVAVLADLTAADFVDSDPLDLDHLSLRDSEEEA